MRERHKDDDCDHEDCRQRRQAADRLEKAFDELKLTYPDGDCEADEVPVAIWETLSELLSTVEVRVTPEEIREQYRRYRADPDPERARVDAEKWALGMASEAVIKALEKAGMTPRRIAVERVRREAIEAAKDIPPDAMARIVRKLLDDLGVDVAQVLGVSEDEDDTPDSKMPPSSDPAEYWIAERAHPAVEAHWNEWCLWVTAERRKGKLDEAAIRMRYDEAAKALDILMHRHHPVISALSRGATAMWRTATSGGMAVIATSPEALEQGERCEMHVVYIERSRAGKVLGLRRTSPKPESWGAATTWEEARWQFAAKLRHPEGMPMAAEGPLPADLSGIDFDRALRELKDLPPN